ncbi:hypothetical protein PIROE2DRAFT_63892 [Piromyces sp. E2]|nr:hypothetical protein PIROE2DRAFT_63892 [Piromyces sp. E2]|eukprot:OUM59251.1 hypothetical protein PIROE2DRAFT_63892 [Piromyces sp. E2]
MDCKEFTWVLFCVLIWIICCCVPSSEAYDDNLFSDTLIVIKKTNDTIQSRTAAFGPRVSEEGIRGIVVPMNLLNRTDPYIRHGCREATEEELKKIRNREDGFIALVERGGRDQYNRSCSFSQKVRNMQKSGAKAVIVGNDHDDYHLVTMYASDDTSDIDIPSVFILRSDMHYLEHVIVGKEDKDGIEFGEVDIVEAESDWPMADIFMVTTLLPIIFIFGIFIIYKFRMESLDVEFHNGSSVSIGAATQEEVDALPIKVFSMEKKKENDPETCAVCIDDFKDGDKLRVLPCHHEYHVECIDLWLTTRKSFCPICKRCINGDDDADETTPLLGNSSNNNNYNTDDQSLLSSSSDNHIIDIDTEEESQHVLSEQDNEDNPTPQEEELIQSSDDEDNSDENEPLINLVTRS